MLSGACVFGGLACHGAAGAMSHDVWVVQQGASFGLQLPSAWAQSRPHYLPQGITTDTQHATPRLQLLRTEARARVTAGADALQQEWDKERAAWAKEQQALQAAAACLQARAAAAEAEVELLKAHVQPHVTNVNCCIM